jgi:hypothetical protein
MIGIVVFHVLMLLLGLGVAAHVISAERAGHVLGYLHKTIGITTPRPEQVRVTALIWVGSVVIIIDGCLLLLVFIASRLGSG